MGFWTQWLLNGALATMLVLVVRNHYQLRRRLKELDQLLEVAHQSTERYTEALVNARMRLDELTECVESGAMPLDATDSGPVGSA